MGPQTELALTVLINTTFKTLKSDKPENRDSHAANTTSGVSVRNHAKRIHVYLFLRLIRSVHGSDRALLCLRVVRLAG